MGETRVDLLHLLEDLRDAYPGALEETILTEVIANALDSGAARLTFATDPPERTLAVIDDGSGMKRRDLARYHDIAASTKVRGEGIGFAGVGIKLGLLVCDEVVTETRRGTTHVATTWALASRQKAPWRWMPPPGLVAEHGTAVRMKLKNPLSPLLDGGFVSGVIERHFGPLLDATFDEILADHYGEGVRFVVNGLELRRHGASMSRVPVAIKLGRKRKPSAVGYLERAAGPLPDDRRGVAVSTLGKVIRRGWDWIGVTSATADQIGGMVEVPALAECLTLNKADFLRSGPRGMTYLTYRKAIQEVVAAQLGVWGDAADHYEKARRRKTRPLERDLEGVLADLAADFPLIATLVERRAGGQRQLPMGKPGGGKDAVPVAMRGGTMGPRERGAGHGGGDGDDDDGSDGGDDADAADAAATAAAPPPEGEPRAAPLGSLPLPGKPGRKKPGRYGIAIQFESRPEDEDLGRLVESTVWVNDAHPAYRRAAASKSEGYHIALAVALALAGLAVEPGQERRFVTSFLARWGEAIDRKPAARGKRVAPSRQRALPLDAGEAPR